MELSPQSVRTTAFKTVKKGYDPDEVDAFKEEVAGAIEAAQNQSTAMEARARAAVAKLQEATQSAAASPAPSALAPSHDDAETISRTLLLAQRTADVTVAEAKLESDSILKGARDEATATLDSARSMASRLLDEARAEARRSAEDERLKAQNEVQSLLARRDFLVSDVDHLEQYIGSQRERVRDAAVALHELVDRVPGGLADMHRPLLSASADAGGQSTPITSGGSFAAPPAAVPSAADQHPDATEPMDSLWPSIDTDTSGVTGEPTPVGMEAPREFSLDVPTDASVVQAGKDDGATGIIGDELQ